LRLRKTRVFATLLLITFATFGYWIFSMTQLNSTRIIFSSTMSVTFGGLMGVLWFMGTPRAVAATAHLLCVIPLALGTISQIFKKGGTIDGDGSESGYGTMLVALAVTMSDFTMMPYAVMVLYVGAALAAIWLPIVAMSIAGAEMHPSAMENAVLLTLLLVGAGACVGQHATVEEGLTSAAARSRHKYERARRVADAERSASVNKTRFVSVLSHEIRNPLQIVTLQGELLSETRLAPRQRMYVRGMCEAADLVLRIVSDVLDISKIEAGSLVLEEVPFDLMELVESCLQMQATRAASSGINLVYRVSPNSSARVLGDPTRIRQILGNLVANALKFSKGRDAEVEVTVWSGKPVPSEGHEVTREWSVAVRDCGIGLDKTELGKVFEEYEQAATSTTREYGGTGLGLPIARLLSRRMHGDVTVSSPGHGFGCTFTMTVMLPDDRSTPARKLPEWHPLPANTLPRTCILVVARNTCVRDTLLRYVRHFARRDSTINVFAVEDATGVESELAGLGTDNSRLLVLLDVLVLTSALQRKFRETLGPNLATVLMNDDVVARNRTTVDMDAWNNLLPKPVFPIDLFALLKVMLKEPWTSRLPARSSPGSGGVGVIRRRSSQEAGMSLTHGTATSTNGLRRRSSEMSGMSLSTAVVAATASPTSTKRPKRRSKGTKAKATSKQRGSSLSPTRRQ
jgi:signal transduction histidine kinase